MLNFGNYKLRRFWQSSTVLLQTSVHLLRRQVLMKVVIYLHRRRPAAGADAFYLFQGEHSVRCCLFVSYTELLFAVVKKFLATPKHATDVRAHLHMKLAQRFSV